MTNADKIRKMTDEELAVFFCDRMEYCIECTGYEFCDVHKGNANGLLKWLKKEVDDG